MARPRKNGLDYFPLDTNFFKTPKMVCISGECGMPGEIVTLRLLCELYAKGYYLEWTECIKYTLCHDLGNVQVQELEEIVKCLIKWGIFDRELYESEDILTSAEIQCRYFTALKRRIHEPNLKHLLINLDEFGIIVAETAVSTSNNPAKKRKIKANKNKKDNVDKLPYIVEDDESLTPTMEDVEQFFSAESLNGSPERFYKYNEAREWKIQDQPVQNWQSLAREWSSHERTPHRPQTKRTTHRCELDSIRELDLRHTKEAAEAAAREAKDNPEGLTPAQSLQCFKERNGLTKDQSITSFPVTPKD